MKKLSVIIKNEREKRKENDSKWTQGYVADLVGVARPTYTAYENGTKEPPIDTLIKLADVLDLDLNELRQQSGVSSTNEDEYRLIARAKELPEDKFDQVKEFIDFLYEQGNKKKGK